MDEWSLDCVVAESNSEVTLKAWAGEVWPEGTDVERDIDGIWFPAVVVLFCHDSTFTVRFKDDDNIEEMVEVDELRAKRPDGTFEYLSPEVAQEAASKLTPPEPPTEEETGSASQAATGTTRWEKVEDMDLGAWEASETGSEASSRPQTNTSSQGSEGSDWVVVEGAGGAGGVGGPPPEEQRRRPGRGRPPKAEDQNAIVADVASGSGLRALRALRRSKLDGTEAGAATGA